MSDNGISAGEVMGYMVVVEAYIREITKFAQWLDKKGFYAQEHEVECPNCAGNGCSHCSETGVRFPKMKPTDTLEEYIKLKTLGEGSAPKEK
jgi:hypothetical protein